jgi:hypothetical protein
VRLDEDQLDALATLIAAKLQAPPTSPGLVDAKQLAAHLGVARSFIYAHADELGGRRLGGKHGRLRFEVSKATAAFAASSQAEPPKSAPRRRRARAHVGGSILQVRG